jgi:hypothetical protein
MGKSVPLELMLAAISVVRVGAAENSNLEVKYVIFLKSTKFFLIQLLSFTPATRHIEDTAYVKRLKPRLARIPYFVI